MDDDRRGFRMVVAGVGLTVVFDAICWIGAFTFDPDMSTPAVALAILLVIALVMGLAWRGFGADN